MGSVRRATPRSSRRRFERRPAVLGWYRVYCGVLAAVYLLATAGAAFSLTLDPAELGPEAEFNRGSMVIATLFAGGFAAAFVASFFAGQQPWGWTLGIVLICLGFTSLCCLPVCIWMLIAWLKPPVKAYFGRDAAPLRRARRGPPPAAADDVRPRSSSRRGGGRRGRRR